MEILLLLCAAYLLGSIPFGLLLTKKAGLGDIRSIGSGNIGATNVLRTGNKKIAFLTLLLDVLKGAIPTLYAAFYMSDYAAYVAFICIIGHVFPVWLGFKGGKGVATALGVYVALNLILGFITALLWLTVAKIFRISSLSALIAFVISPCVAYFLMNPPHLLPFTLLTALLILWTHRENIERLIKGQDA
jgi:glycerol-3-phosphate acyltransferase PlsY